MKKWIFSVAAIVLIAGVSWGFYLFNKPHTGISSVAATESVTALALYNAYQANEKSADAKYLDKIIEVTGVVNDVSKTDTSISINLKGDAMGGINCSLAMADNKMPVPAAGANITLKGKCTGFLMDVALVDCIIENKK